MNSDVVFHYRKQEYIKLKELLKTQIKLKFFVINRFEASFNFLVGPELLPLVYCELHCDITVTPTKEIKQQTHHLFYQQINKTNLKLK